MGQVVVMKMPDILLLAKESNSELSYSAMNDILLLILGCAIQCEKKEEFIEHIKQLDVDVQRGLVLSIQEITENPDNVIPYRINDLAEVPRDELLILCENLYRHLQGAMEQRDDYIETIIDFVLLQDSEEGAREEREGNKEVEESPKFRPRNSITQASFHSNNLLQAKKEKISNLQAELDEQNAMMVDMKEEYNRNLAENVVYYKNLIGKLIKCLILAGHTNQDISDKAKEEHRKNMSLLATLKQPTQLEQQDITTSLDELAQHLAKKGVFVDISTLKDTIVNGVDAKVGETSEERKDEDEETNVLRGTLDERESRILQLERSVAEMGTQGEEVSKLKKEIAIKDESITQLKDNLDRSNELVSRMSSQLKNDVSEKEQKVIKLKQSEQKLKDVKVRNTDLENDIASKDQTIAHLKRSMDSMQGLSVLNNDLKDTLSMKEHQISELEKTVEELDIKENGKKCEENEAKNQLIMEENKLKEREVKLKEKEMKVKEKEAKVKEKESKDKDSKIKLEGKEKLVKGKEIEIKEKESEIKEKEREVNEKEAELEEKEKLVEEKETELK